MKYISTRNKDIEITPSQAIIQGIAKDGGLFVPFKIPKISLDEIIDLNYKDLAFKVMKQFLTDFSEYELKDCIEKAYDNKFDTDLIAPLKEIGDDYFLELYHGTTLAFKDMALSILPHLLKTAMKINDIKEEVVILTATSGDTGKAALEGFADVEGIKIIVFYPEDGVSKIQKLQMKTQEGNNTLVVGINGNFDDAQSGVKELFNNEVFLSDLNNNNYILSSANSINIGRLVPQIVYYFYSYITLVSNREIQIGESINIAVPTGNFGNILAAYYAKEMGLPINKLICASNENKVLTDFLNTGEYDRRRELQVTTSPSMDILISSNLERLLFHINNENDKLILNLMNQLSTNGFYRVNKDQLIEFHGDFTDMKRVEASIRQVFEQYDYLIDTHTAVAYYASQRYKSISKDNRKTIIVSTASPFKFSEAVASSIGLNNDKKDEFQIIDALSQKSRVPIPKAISSLKYKPIIHNKTCNKEDMRMMVEDFLKVGENYD